jgi:hypothetical protein
MELVQYVAGKIVFGMMQKIMVLGFAENVVQVILLHY